MIALALAVVCETPIVALASRLVFDESVSVREALRTGVQSMGRVIGARVLQALALGVSAFAIVAPFWVQGVLLFAPEVALLEKASAFSACARSQRLASRSTGESVGAAILLAALRIAGAPLGDHVLRTVMSEIFDATPPPSIWAEGCTVFSLVGFFAVVPFVAVARFFVYLNVFWGYCAEGVMPSRPASPADLLYVFCVRPSVARAIKPAWLVQRFGR